MKFPGRMVDVAVIFHVVGVTSTIGKNGSGNATFGFDVVVTAHFSNVFWITAYTNQFGIVCSDHFFGFGNIYSKLGMSRDLSTKIFHRLFFHILLTHFKACIFPGLETTIEYPHVFYSGVHHDKCISNSTYVTGCTAREFIIIIGEHEFPIKHNSSVGSNSMFFQSFLQLFRTAAVPCFR